MNLVELAQRLKQRRIDLGMSVEEVANAAGLTRSWLSKVENFRVTPSLQALAKLSEALRIDIGDLLAGLSGQSRIVAVRQDKRRRIERDPDANNTTIYEAFLPADFSAAMEPMVLTIPPGGGRETPLSHEGEEFLVVQSGAVDLEYEGETLRLNAGDAVYFNATRPHRVSNPGDEQTVCVCVHAFNAS